MNSCSYAASLPRHFLKLPSALKGTMGVLNERWNSTLPVMHLINKKDCFMCGPKMCRCCKVQKAICHDGLCVRRYVLCFWTAHTFLGMEFGSQQLFPLHEFFSEWDVLLCSQVCREEVRCGSEKRKIKKDIHQKKKKENVSWIWTEFFFHWHHWLVNDYIYIY